MGPTPDSKLMGALSFLWLLLSFTLPFAYCSLVQPLGLAWLYATITPVILFCAMIAVDAVSGEGPQTPFGLVLIMLPIVLGASAVWAGFVCGLWALGKKSSKSDE